jgi:L-rhamnose-H+ transport protein
MQVLLGILFHLTGGVAAGSFYMPYKKVRGWNWESYWIVGGLFSWLIVPPLIAWLTLPDFLQILVQASGTTIVYTLLFGILWGIGGLTFGLGIRYLGMSLGNSIVLGLSAAFGSLVPAIYYDFFQSTGKTTFTELITHTWGQVVLLGILVCLIGIGICGWAGLMKEKQLDSKANNRANVEFNLTKGILVAICSGILSACFNFGIEAGKPLAEVAITMGFNPLYQNNVIFVLLLWGGLTSNLVWCVFLNVRNNSFSDYTKKSVPLFKNYLFCALAGTTWFMQFFFYGMGESKLGNGATSWVLHMLAIILVGNMWGIVLKEWKDVNKKTKYMITMGITVILSSVAILGYGNYLS